MGIYERIMGFAVQVKRILNGTHAQTAFTRNLEKIQYKSPGELKALQAVSLCELLIHAVNNIPYYKHLKPGLGLTPETAFEDIKKFPVMTKEILIEKNELLAAEGTDATGRMETSGTLGHKSSVLTDKYTLTHSPDEFFNKKIGIVPGKSRLIQKTVSRKRRVAPGNVEYSFDRVARSYVVSYGYLNEARYKFMAETWLDKKPSIIWGFSQPLCNLALYMEKNDIKVPSPELILVGGQTLLPQWKDTLERLWGAKVYDRYGSVEAGNTANQCSEQNGYHYVPTVHYIEILDEKLEPVKEGETGSIYITTLSKRAMPMIRYKQDDLVVFTEKLCSCGCNFPIIQEILGKRREGIISPSMAYVCLGPINSIITKSGEISDFQVVQTQKDTLLIKLVEKMQVKEETLTEISESICGMLDYDMKITYEKVKKIKTLTNGKLLRIIPFDRIGEMNEPI